LVNPRWWYWLTTLAAQLCNELREFFTTRWFVSYYDTINLKLIFQSLIPIEKTASINDEIDMLRHWQRDRCLNAAM